MLTNETAEFMFASAEDDDIFPQMRRFSQIYFLHAASLHDHLRKSAQSVDIFVPNARYFHCECRGSASRHTRGRLARIHPRVSTACAVPSM